MNDKNLPQNTELLKELDPEIAEAILSEANRQNNTIELIASENVVSNGVLAAMGSILTNKYAEGYPKKRYYGGCEYVDVVEDLAIARAKSLFGAEHINVQPHSGSQANMAVYFAVLKPGDTVLGMNLGHGGHLTHGAKVSASGKIFKSVQYGVKKEDGLIDILLDYCTPEYRDFSIGQYLFTQLRNEGVTSLTFSGPDSNHRDYLEKNGFTKSGNCYLKVL